MRINRQLQLQLLALVAITACLVTWFPNEVNAASVKQARITRVNNHVQLLHSTTTARPASVNDIVEEGTVIRTGSSSRAELTFPDETVVRLAAKTAFSFKNGTRDLNLIEGAMLIQIQIARSIFETESGLGREPHNRFIWKSQLSA